MNVSNAVTLIARTLDQIDGFELPMLQAELLLSDTLACSVSEMRLLSERELAKREESLVYRYLNSKPLRPVPLYLGYCEVGGLKLKVDSSTLLPGTETQRCIEIAGRLIQELEAKTVVDAGTGCGVIGAVLAAQFQACRVYATELCPAAAQVARTNIVEHDLQSRSSVHEGDWLTPLNPLLDSASVDLIISNPPYCAEAEIRRLPTGFLDYAPRAAINGGADGLAGHRAVIDASCKFLRPGGWLLLQTDTDQAAAVAHHVESTGQYESVQFERGSGLQYRFVIARMKL